MSQLHQEASEEGQQADQAQGYHGDVIEPHGEDAHRKQARAKPSVSPIGTQDSRDTKDHPEIRTINSMRCFFDLKSVIFKLMSRINILRISCEIALRWIPHDLTDDKSTLFELWR